MSLENGNGHLNGNGKHSTEFLPTETRNFYVAGVEALQEAGIPFLVGGAYALGPCTGIERHTKDFDIFMMPQDAQRALDVLAEKLGCRTEMTFPHWLGKAYSPQGDFIDVIFSSGNGVAVVDEEWFEHAKTGTVLGKTLLLCPKEEILWSKAFICERERYDGADVAHLFRTCATTMDWPRIMRRFDEKWRVLLSHLVLFGFIYPHERGNIPSWVMRELMDRLEGELDQEAPKEHVCRGTLISREQYLPDIEKWGYEDARLRPDVRMTADDIAHWTKAIETGK